MNFFSPAPHIKRLPKQQIERLYPLYRLDILSATFIGYATFYLVRNNLSTVAKELDKSLHYDYSMVGNILAVSAISYGIGKFLMGSLSDRSDPRKFMAFGLLLTAICNLIFGSVTGNYEIFLGLGTLHISSYHIHLGLWALNGAIQGMGWPPCGRCIGHWFSVRERGTVFSIWNTATNVGGGLAGIIAAQSASYWGWRSAFYVPAAIAMVGAVYLFWRLRDTPQSVGLPPIEEYKNDYTEAEKIHGAQERELTAKELFVDNILKNKYLWLFAFANFFVYIVRYSMLDWGPTYLRDVKGANLVKGGYAILILEWAAIFPTILMGWWSDKLGGRRGMVSLLCMIPILCAFGVMIMTPKGFLWLDFTMLAVIGCFVYPPVMLLALAALDLTSKKAVGTAAGFIGMFGYIGRTAQAKGFGWMVDYYKEVYDLNTAWNIVLYSILGCTVLGIIVLSFTWRIRPKA